MVSLEHIQFSTGNAHPLAADHAIIVCHIEQTSEYDTLYGEKMEFFGENLALIINVRQNPQWMYVFHWKTGKAKCVSNSAFVGDSSSSF